MFHILTTESNNYYFIIKSRVGEGQHGKDGVNSEKLFNPEAINLFNFFGNTVETHTLFCKNMPCIYQYFILQKQYLFLYRYKYQSKTSI
jgi:hypothetical protein